VIDNGKGMSTDDVDKSYLRYSTSKINDVNDLFSIKTLGFRGEALASIAAVSKLTIISKEKDQLIGKKVVIEGGTEVLNDEYGSPSGTIIEIKDLFYNTPVRKKYLKSIEIELRHIIEVVTNYALIHPNIHFQLIHNSRTIFNSTSTNDFLANISYIYGNDVAKQMIKLNFESELYKIYGYISKPSLTRSTKNDQSIYVNKRYIKKNKIISDAINNAYHTLVMVNRYPVVFLNIEIDTSKIDVNVHPQKAEIRIENEQKLYEVVNDAIKNALHKEDLTPQIKQDVEKKLDSFVNVNYESKYEVDDSKQELLINESSETYVPKLSNLKVLGILNKTYILSEIPGNFLLIDQHAAAERILYEKFMKQIKSKDVKIQKLLKPEILEVSSKKFLTAINNVETFKELGFEIEEFGINTIMVRTIPILFGRQFDKETFLDYIDEIEKKGTPSSLDKFFHDRIASKACRTAIKAGDEITLPEIKKYVQELMQMDVPYNCPHGRPIMIKWSYYEIEKMFKRVV
jgi:DNA mismatch repair protein MutL